MGMHLDMPEQQFPDRAAREHRKRVWWTAYVLDRLWASKMGHPVSVQDVDIAVDLPSDFGLSETEAADFLDVQYMNASIRLARISQEIISSIYNRRATDVAFSQRVQKALSNLSGWVGGSSTTGSETDGIEKVLEEKYLKFCNPENPVHYITTWLTRSYFAKFRLVEHYAKYSPGSLQTNQTDAQLILVNVRMVCAKGLLSIG